MAKEFTTTPIRLMGEEFYFKRCPTDTLKVFDEKIQEKIDSSEKIRLEGEALTEESERLQKKIDNIDKKVELIERKEEPTDKELDRVFKYIDEQDKLLDELKAVKKQIEEYNNEYRDYFKQFNDEINEIIADKLEALLDKFDKEFFLKNYDVVDMRIATNISKYYEMCMLGERASKVQETIRKDAEMISGRAEQLTRGHS
jgi:chromosome segregation ATPase